MQTVVSESGIQYGASLPTLRSSALSKEPESGKMESESARATEWNNHEAQEEAKVMDRGIDFKSK